MENNIFILLIIFQIKHYLADFPLQNEYMLGKFKEQGWVLPLSCHVGVHALFTIMISLCFTSIGNSVLLGLLDFVIHFIMDRIKASPKLLGKHVNLSKTDFYRIQDDLANHPEGHPLHDEINKSVTMKLDSNKKFWRALGIDQMVHHLTHYVIIYLLVTI